MDFVEFGVPFWKCSRGCGSKWGNVKLWKIVQEQRVALEKAQDWRAAGRACAWAAEEEAKEEPCARSELNKTPKQNQRKEKEDQQRSLRCGL